MIPQFFKGDPQEVQVYNAGAPAFDSTELALDAYYNSAYNGSDFILSLFDTGRVPFGDRVPRAAYVNFFKEALKFFTFTGSFESYIFILQGVFGTGSGILFTVPAPGKLEILINAATAISVGWAVQEIVDGVYVQSDLCTNTGELIEFRTLSGISGDAQLKQLLSELIPAGIFPTITIQFFSIESFIAWNSSSTDIITTNDGEQIVFLTLGA